MLQRAAICGNLLTSSFATSLCVLRRTRLSVDA